MEFEFQSSDDIMKFIAGMNKPLNDSLELSKELIKKYKPEIFNKISEEELNILFNFCIAPTVNRYVMDYLHEYFFPPVDESE